MANQKKARETLDAMVTALGGQRWLTLTSTMQQGRTSGFYQGKPTGATSDFYEIQKFPDQTRIELGKKRDVVEIINGDQVWEVTYKGKRELPKDQVRGTAPPSRPFHPDSHARLAQRSQDGPHLWRPKPGGAPSGRSDHAHQLQKMTASPSRPMPRPTCPCGGAISGAIRFTRTRIPTRKNMTDYEMVEGLPTAYTLTRYHNGDMTNQRFLFRAAYDIPLTPDMFNPDQAAAKIKK